jgi:toxin ParE1/3/4
LTQAGSRIQLLPGIKADLDRIIEHLAAHGVENIPDRVDELLQGLDLLALHPRIGRPVENGSRRELIMGRGSRGYVALYEYILEVDTVIVVAIRSQREAGYSL